jgi:hypothetical protein
MRPVLPCGNAGRQRRRTANVTVNNLMMFLHHPPEDVLLSEFKEFISEPLV